MRLLNLIVLFVLLLPAAASAQISFDGGGVNGGAVRVGTSTTTCDAAAEGAIRYNDSTNNIELCNGSGWQPIVASSCDNAPAYPIYTNQTSVATSTLTSSNILEITGMDAGCSVNVGVVKRS